MDIAVFVLLVAGLPFATLIAGYAVGRGGRDEALQHRAKPPREKAPQRKRRNFAIAMVVCASLLFLVFLTLGTADSVGVPRSLAWRLGAVFLMLGPVVFATGLAFWPKGVDEKYREVAASEILAPWIVAAIILSTVAWMKGELAEFVDSELALIALLFPWLGTVRIVMAMVRRKCSQTKARGQTRGRSPATKSLQESPDERRGVGVTQPDPAHELRPNLSDGASRA